MSVARPAPDDPHDGLLWVDDEAGPLIRPYAMTSGRTRPRHGDLDLIAVIVATRPTLPSDGGLGSVYAEIMAVCQRPVSVAEVASYLRLPAGTVRVLLSDLLERRLVRRRAPVNVNQLPSADILKAVIDGIRAL
ncbi:DUF742 domain-containing protein [Catellatospora sichuanensis]|uniref:DUF742 domain-containing protein n=1 Tax=Catellatospora sichuanensis TaxID=1969805 RepID=UPI001FE93D00|nr:DUF742 domain-containing protein [Catellatospora sichuanensis]